MLNFRIDSSLLKIKINNFVKKCYHGQTITKNLWSLDHYRIQYQVLRLNECILRVLISTLDIGFNGKRL